ncbi:MAG: hypothetical protein JSW50_10280 [Candidatus Latescibacterota bacterium]|nr:MAG: hypothetical protein JSW50_10280 [Candidatus Latescibacterota bacterium]
MKRSTRLPLGIKIIIGFHLFSFVIWFLGQSVAVVAYDTVAGWGLQDSRALVDPVIVEVNRAIGLTDTIVMLPLFLVAAMGLIRRRFYGAIASWLAFGMTLYWPVIFWCSQGFYAAAGIKHQPMVLAYILLPGAIWLIAAWGSWYLGRNREVFQ